MATLEEVTTPRPVADGYQLDVAAGWRQGRGAFGGLVVGSLIRAIELHVGDPGRRVRSVTAELPGPVEHGGAAIEVQTLRAGKNVSTARAALTQHGEVRAHAVAILGAARAAGEAPTWNDRRPPDAPAWTSVAPAPIARGPWPEFAQHFEYRVIEGLPTSGGRGDALGWIRPRDPGAARGASFLAAAIDAWWPCAMNRLPALRPMATIAFTLELIAELEARDHEAPLLYRASAPVCTEGYAREARELWTADGRLVAINYQTFAIIQ